MGEFTPVERRLKFEPTAWCPRSGVTHRSPRKVTEKTEYSRVVGFAMCTCGGAPSWDTWLSPACEADRHMPSRHTAAVPLTDRLKPPPLLMYIDLGNDSGAEQRSWQAEMTPREKLNAFDCG